MDTYRLLITFLLLVVLLVLYEPLVSRFYPPPPPSHNHAETMAKGATPNASGAPASSEAATSAGMTAPSSGNSEAQPAGAAGPERVVTVDTRYYEAVLTSRGARIRNFLLKRFKQTVAADSPPYEIIKPGASLPFGVVVTRGDNPIEDGAVDYTSDSPPAVTVKGDGTATVTFVGHEAGGLTITKSYVFDGSGYPFRFSADLSGATAGVQSIGITTAQSLTALAGYRDIPELQAEVAGKAITENQKSLIKGVQPVGGPITYAGFGDRYFLLAVLPQAPMTGTLQMSYGEGEATVLVDFARATNVKASVFMGPKELDLLEAANPALRKAIDFGWAGMLALPFLRLLQLFHRIVPNYGLAIILLTIVVRLLTLPMSIKSQRSMMKMQRLQPQVERIRERFKDDQERLNREMVDLYKRNHVNPLGGCLPMVIQFPILIGLYEALLNAVELRQAPFILWIKDLSAPDSMPIPGIKIPYVPGGGLPVLVLAMAATSFLQQWMTPKQPDPNQQRMMMIMPLVFTFLFISFPAGLSLYYFFSNLLGVIQQYVLNREFKQYGPVPT